VNSFIQCDGDIFTVLQIHGTGGLFFRFSGSESIKMQRVDKKKNSNIPTENSSLPTHTNALFLIKVNKDRLEENVFQTLFGPCGCFMHCFEPCEESSSSSSSSAGVFFNALQSPFRRLWSEELCSARKGTSCTFYEKS
jgi:hypothetical protein